MTYTKATRPDGPEAFFDEEKATVFAEDTQWNGHNFVSINTGRPHQHQALLRTASGAYILNTWSSWQGSLPTYQVIEKDEAHAWLMKNHHVSELSASEREAWEQANVI